MRKSVLVGALVASAALLVSAETPASPPRASPCAHVGDAICLSNCDELVSRIEPRVVPRVIACLRKANSGDTCVPPAAYACVEDALPTTTRDAAAEADCARLARVCHGRPAPADWRRRCASVFPSLTARGRAAVIACMSAGQCAGMPYFDEDVGSCVYEDHVA